MNFTWTEIAELLGVSLMTIYRRRREFGMLGVANGAVSDEELRTVLYQMRRNLLHGATLELLESRLQGKSST